MVSRNHAPLKYNYHALIGGLFKAGILNHACAILDEMIDGGTIPDVSTFRVPIAGYY